METITFEIKAQIRLKMTLIDYPEIHSRRQWVQKGISILKSYAPRVLAYLSREHILARLDRYDIFLKTRKKMTDEKAKSLFKTWIKKKKAWRSIFVIIEALVIPFTGFLALLPGPNFFFYVPALLLYYHFMTYRSLRKIDVAKLNISIIRS
ncbi:MAG: hypothetical protein L0Y73_03320 [Candidatus Aminicenantes bacterium]|nr:hypothetical protein [Candidatus Aminicenantes bacterium]